MILLGFTLMKDQAAPYALEKGEMHMGNQFHGLQRKGRGSGLKSLFLGFAAASVCLLLLYTLTAALVYSENIPMNFLPLAAKLLFGLSLTVGCWITVRKARTAKLPLAAANAVLFTLAAGLGHLAITGNGVFPTGTLFAISAAAMLTGCVLGLQRQGKGYK
jgi:hypothetical protein